jgi:hypothetical protein
MFASGRIVAAGGICKENAVLEFSGSRPAIGKEDLSGVTGGHPIKLRPCLRQPLFTGTGCAVQEKVCVVESGVD